ncbi:uncharacterized protein YbaR (Trm112 family) [Scopulibacillus daqui]|uniref:Uncharacterized protein YbaR (Trm112 family) n=1 Tax=Scopulibacillus daqui TaxID=1469162 RepID=A0ABS2PZC2_9BACL|nr:hypothetical protein [Scopulibacillus daqui]MBM7645070.1 uncharacterized protein YbaR (Trm112 family) [Scopulibacillus daqui]
MTKSFGEAENLCRLIAYRIDEEISVLKETETKMKQTFGQLNDWKGHSADKSKQKLNSAFFDIQKKASDLEAVKGELYAKQLQAAFPPVNMVNESK